MLEIIKQLALDAAEKGADFCTIVFMLSLYDLHAFQLSFAPLPGAFEPGPGMVFPQPRPLHSGHSLHFGPICFRASASTSLYVISLSPICF
mgnify:CR=1 FL=1